MSTAGAAHVLLDGSITLVLSISRIFGLLRSVWPVLTGVVADRWVELHWYQCHAVLATFVYSPHPVQQRCPGCGQALPATVDAGSVATAPERPAQSLLTGRVPACLTGRVWC